MSAWTREGWLEGHAYLRPVADFCARIDLAAAAIDSACPPAPSWDEYRSDFLAGVSLLRSSNARIDLEPAGRAVVALVEALAAEPMDGRLAADLRALDRQLRGEADSRAASPIGCSATSPSRPHPRGCSATSVGP